MWPFRRRREKEKRKQHIARKVIVGLVIGGAISSIIGKKLLDKKNAENEKDEK